MDYKFGSNYWCFTVTFSDNTSYTITNGKDGAAGADAVKWEIGTDGFWYKNDVKTEYQAVGQAGEAGVAGVSPYIGENGNWFAYNTENKRSGRYRHLCCRNQYLRGEEW